MNAAGRLPRIINISDGFELALTAAEQRLLDGAIVVIPTDTVYGLAAVANDTIAVDSIFRAKQRPADRRVAVLVSDISQAKMVSISGPDFSKLAERFWPGPLTIVMPRSLAAPSAAGDDATIGVRCPRNRFVTELCRRVGPLATTSANSHGDSPAATAADAAAMLPGVELVVDGGICDSAASTVVDLSGDEPVVLREGQIGASEINAAVRRSS